jgi:hypothetical protein
LFLRAPTNYCVGSGDHVILATRQPVLDYKEVEITPLPALSNFWRKEETMTLTTDALSIIATTQSTRGFQVTTRSASNSMDFGAPTPGPFANINAALPTDAGAWLDWPILSADGLAFYYRVTGSTTAGANGTYESIRASTTVPFPAATLMPAAVQAWESVSAISADRLTLFVTKNYGTNIMTRLSLTEPFANPTSVSPPGSAWRIVPVAGCRTLVGTCEPGGCPNEDICTWAAQ